MTHFDHEKLDVYKVAIEFVALADDIVESLPRGRGYLADQLHRAATSIPLNIAEGAGEYSSKGEGALLSYGSPLGHRVCGTRRCLSSAIIDPG